MSTTEHQRREQERTAEVTAEGLERLLAGEVPSGYDSPQDWLETRSRRHAKVGLPAPTLPAGLPVAAAPARRTERPATERQIGYIQSLQRRAGIEVTPTEELAALNAAAASVAIDALQQVPPRPAPQRPAAPRADLEDGIYLHDGEVYKVQHAVHGSGNQYAKRLVRATATAPVFGTVDQGRWTFEYTPGAIRKLRPEEKMTLEQAREFGALYGTCCVCGRTLTDEGSIEAGIGPVCAGKLA